MMQHYLQMKEEYNDCILFYRLGDFYELFFDDAEECSRVLELTLTGKACGLPERAPMCGVPFHAAEVYINRLAEAGYKVAICEQLEDPKDAKGIVKRGVIRVVTPGTNTNISEMDSSVNSYIMCIFYSSDVFGVAISDVTTGEFTVAEADNVTRLKDEIVRFSPKEVICNEALFMSGLDIEWLRSAQHICVNALSGRYFDDESGVRLIKEHFKVAHTDGLGLHDLSQAVSAAGALLAYLYETQKNDLSNITRISILNTAGCMLIDSSTRRNLELTQTLREKEKRGSLIWILDKTRTAMGARMLRRFLEQPLIDKKAIEDRLDAVSELLERIMDRDEIREYLGTVYDIERLMGRVAFGTANPRDLIALKSSLSMLSPIKELTAGFSSALISKLSEKIDALTDMYELIESAICDEPPISVHDGGVIKEGYSKDADELKKAGKNGKEWLMELETSTRERTGIKNLRIKYNKVFGYYFEVTNSYLSLVPEDFIRKQTLTGGERYTTAGLQEMEDKILNSEERLISLERELFNQVRDILAGNIGRMQETAGAIAYIDVLCSLSYVAEHDRFVRPAINTKGIVDIKGGRHPVVERMIGNDSFVTNDVYLDRDENRISIITGPNMAGKSTYMRLTALIVLMAHIGSFVPCDSADISIVDRIFTRVGASDDLASGQSTFMVEMTEVANIIRNATSDSLIILDEIGRGTSTYDGLAIAWAVVEHISDKKKCGAKTLFATHYHELTELEGKVDGTKNYCFAVKEAGDEVVFLRKVVRGGADKSYGIHVAHLAGVPESVTDRANEIVQELTEEDVTERVSHISVSKKRKKPDEVTLNQLSLFDMNHDDDIITELKKLDVNIMTPMDAMNTLYRLREKALKSSPED
ncbi:MAG: DNA mismatch repair protein MutS [Lachnospiraceae bacterium]|nr:DNA mismatch repair protein MutS [Lachnospiraceae bacterium]